ncbi:MAG: hypothetical protein GF409_01045 [Candidatus Omnitrophica bacterium]|nr:hypothetical protein [Candidatus Omnitrophota bacterium]
MKKLIAVVLVAMLVMGSTVLFAAEKQQGTEQEQSMVRKFWGDFADLFRKQIPETPEQKSDTHNVWKQTKGRGKN